MNWGSKYWTKSLSSLIPGNSINPAQTAELQSLLRIACPNTLDKDCTVLDWLLSN